MSYNPVVRWNGSASNNVNRYDLAWTVNGAAVLPGVAQPGDGGRSFNQDNPLVVLHAGDVVGVTVTADDTVDGLLSSPVTAAPLTIPASPPLPPTNVTLSLS